MLEVHGGLLIWTWITFLVVLFVLAKLVWKPMLAMLDEREGKIAQALADADKAGEDAREAKRKFQETVELARKEAMTIVTESKENAEKLKQSILDQADEKAKSMVEEAQKRIDLEKEKAVAEIRTQVAELSIEIARKLIRKNLDSAGDRELIEESLKSIEKQHEA